MTDQRRNTENVSLRLDSSALGKLKHEAELKRVSFNVLANQIFQEYLDWHSTAAKALLISMPRAFIVKCLEKLSDDEVKQVAKYVAEREVKDILLLMREHYNLETVDSIIESWARVCLFPYRKEPKSGVVYRWVIQHDMSRNFSLYLAELFGRMFTEVGPVKCHFDIPDSSIAFEVMMEPIGR